MLVFRTRIFPLPAAVLAAFFCVAFAFPAIALELTPQEKDFIASHGTIRVHNESAWPPFNFYENGTPQGISIDVMNRIAELTGLHISYITGPSWDEFTRMIENGNLDVMLNIIDLPERCPHFRFSSPYVKSLTGVFVSGRKNNRYNSFADLAGKTVAIPAGFDFSITMPKYHPKVKLLPVRDILACIEAVNAGRAEAFMEEIGVVDYIISQRVMSNIRMAFEVSEEAFVSDLTIGTRRDLPVLHAIIQKGLNAISGDELNKIRKKWLLKANEIYEKSIVNLSVAEKEYLYGNNLVKICVDPSWPPLDFIDASGKHSGLSADLSKKIASRLGITLELLPTDSWEQSLANVRIGKCDVIPLLNETREASVYLDFSRPYFDFPTVIATHKENSFIGGYSELYGKTVALQSYFFITEIIRADHPKINIIEVANTREAMKLVSQNKAFATIDSLPAVVNAIEAMALENIKIAGSVPQENRMKLGVRKGNNLLYSILDKGVASLSEREKIGLYKKWLDIKVEPQFISRKMVFRATFVFSIILIFMVWRQITLGRYAKKLQLLNRQLHHYSTVDHLTQLLNRRSIEKRLETEIDKAKIAGNPLSLVIFDIDHFKEINDTCGHLIGDDVLQKMANLVAGSIRHNDHLGRWGGEEFLLVLPDTNVSGCEKMAEKLRQSVASCDFGINRTVTASFGLGEYTPPETATTFISRVDSGLYSAKEQGRNRITTIAPIKPK